MADTFDWKALGLTPLYDNAKDRTDSSEYDQGTLSGYYKQPDADGMIDQYDLDGKLINRYKKNDVGIMPLVKQVASSPATKILLAALGAYGLDQAGLLGSAASTGGAEAAAAVGESAGYGGYGGLTGSLSSGLTAGGDAMLGGSLVGDVAGYGGVTGALNATSFGGEFLNPEVLRSFSDAGSSAVEVGGGVGGGALEEPVSTLGTLSGSGYTPAVGDAGLASNVTSGGLNSLNAAGVNAAEFAGVTGALNATGGGGFMETLKNSFSAVNEWAKENPLWTNMLGGMGAMVNGVLNRDNNLDVVKEQGKNQIDLEKLKEEERLAKNKAYSQSIAGLKIPGLINARPVDPASRMPAFSGLINARG